jgi:transcriptional regulator of acetoin/glycerol metabolism
MYRKLRSAKDAAMRGFSLPSIQSARTKFFRQGELPIDEVEQPILRSWLRCAELGLDQSRAPRIEPPDRQELQSLCERHERLRRLCRPELDALNAEARDTGGIAILTNAQGMVLDAVGDAAFAGEAAAVTLRPGARWSEGAAGTNAIGTALAERRGVCVHGAEHFFETHQMLSCAAIPIIDPRGVVVGVLDLSAHARVQRIHALGLVRLAADQIEHRFFNGGGFDEYAVLRFHTDPAVIGAVREGLLVFDDAQRLIAANRRGLSFIQRDWDALDEARFEELFETPKKTAQPTELTGADGRRFFGILNLPADQSRRGRAGDLPWAFQDGLASGPAARIAEQKLRDAELSAMRAALDACEGNVSKAARSLGVHRSTLYRRLFHVDRAPGGRI